MFLSTLEEIFKGNKALFERCHIAASNYDWQPYPVLSFNFAGIASDTTERLNNDLRAIITHIGKEQGIDVEGPSLEFQLSALIKALASKGRVVILIDEYDKPIVDHLYNYNVSVAEGNRRLLQSFFGVLKNLDQYIKFTFITGIRRFAQPFLFSGATHLNDISMDTRYAAMVGYTQEEFDQYFAEYVQAVAEEKTQQGKRSTEEKVLEEIKVWYHGYRFSKAESYLYNPFSILNYLIKKECGNYWYETEMPSFLLQQMDKHPNSIVPLSGTEAKESALISSGTGEETNFKALMFQIGYLTIEAYNETMRYYQLGFPNYEVRMAFTYSMTKHFAKL